MANSPRPGVWVLERSVDNGTTWQPWQYFAGNNRECQKFFGVYSFESRDPKVINSDDEVRIFFIQFFYLRSKISPIQSWSAYMYTTEFS